MKSYTLCAIILVNLGLAAAAFQGVSYTTTENVVVLGSLQMTADTTGRFPWPRIVAGICIVGGIALLVGAKQEKSLNSADE